MSYEPEVKLTLNKLIEQLQQLQQQGNGEKSVKVFDSYWGEYIFSKKLDVKTDASFVYLDFIE